MIGHLFPHLRRSETAPPAVAPMPVSLPPIAAPERIEQLVMRRTVAWEIEPCEVRFFRCGPNIVARFFDARGRLTGQGDHPGCWSVSDFVDFYWPRGWEVAAPVESPGVPAHSEACYCP